MLSTDPTEVVETRWRARTRGDWRLNSRFFDPNFQYDMNVPQDVWFFAGQTNGLPAYMDRMSALQGQFEILRYDPTIMSADGETVRGSIAYRIRHRKSGYVFDGGCRQVARVQKGHIVALEEFHDVERIKAFMRMVSYAAIS
jgi:ketosteroid isomerase-like protein